MDLFSAKNLLLTAVFASVITLAIIAGIAISGGPTPWAIHWAGLFWLALFPVCLGFYRPKQPPAPLKTRIAIYALGVCAVGYIVWFIVSHHR